ncbi:MAG TPA: hypothetical protein VGI43_10715 [Mucilaginibacter sp.]|jgi:hypothetical protein
MTIEEISELIIDGEEALKSDLYEKQLYVFWEHVKISPEKWEAGDYGKEGGGFWIVGLYGKNAIWYNDIEEGFNVSSYHTYGTINNYAYEQYALNQIIYQLYNSLLKIN